MKKRQGLAAILAAVTAMALLGGCGGNDESSQADENRLSENTQNGQEIGSANAGTDNKDVPTIVIYNNSGAFSVSGAEAGSDEAAYKEMQDYILDQTGVKVEIIMPPSDASAEKEKLNLLLAGGDQIDAWWEDDWGKYAKDGIIIPLNEYLEAPEAKALWDLWEPWGSWEKMTDSDGNIWAIPRNTDTVPYPIMYRTDWLDLLGMDVPSTLDELNDYLYKIKELDPYGNGETIPLMLEKGTSELGILDRAEYAFLGGYVENGNGKWIDETDGKVKPEWLADGYTDFLKQMNQWYQDGIIHKENFTMDVDTVRGNITKGAVAASAAWYSRVTLTEATTRENIPDFDRDKYTYAYCANDKGTIGPNGSLMQTRSVANTRGLMISSKCKHPEAVMKFVEWSFEWENYTTEQYGLEGKYWQYNPESENAKENKDVVLIEGGPTYARDFLMSLAVPLEVQTTEYDDDGIQEMHNFWLQKRLSDYQSTIDPGIENGIVWDKVALAENIPSLNDLNTYKDEELIKFVNGTRSLDTWDAFIEECYQIGLQDYIDEYTRQYEEMTNN